jgi:hypothetical protein
MRWSLETARTYVAVDERNGMDGLKPGWFDLRDYGCGGELFSCVTVSAGGISCSGWIDSFRGHA